MDVVIWETGETKQLTRICSFEHNKDIAINRIKFFNADKDGQFVRDKLGRLTCSQAVYEDWNAYFEMARICDERSEKIIAEHGFENFNMAMTGLKKPKEKYDEIPAWFVGLDLIFRPDPYYVDQIIERLIRRQLPDDFQYWDWLCRPLRSDKLFAHFYAEMQPLSETFNQLYLSDGFRSVAHIAAMHGHLPKNFDNWGHFEISMWSVAHLAARYGHLPKDFDQWEIATIEGETVAHLAAMHGHLPPNFDKWDLRDNQGRSVLGYAVMYDQCTPEQRAAFMKTEEFKKFGSDLTYMRNDHYLFHSIHENY